jgi:hypothetical protein
LDAVTLALSHWPAPIEVDCEASKVHYVLLVSTLVSTFDNDKALYPKGGSSDPLEAAARGHEKENA